MLCLYVDKLDGELPPNICHDYDPGHPVAINVESLDCSGDEITMSISVGSDQNRPMENEAYYELVASQEEIYLEEIEEELRAILTFDDLPRSQEVDDPLEQAAEELITGNSDDPPLSDETVRGMLHEPVSK